MNEDLIKLKRFCTAKEIINKIERQPTEWGGEIFENEMTDKGLTSKIYKHFIQAISKNNPVKNGQKTWIDIFQRRHTDGQQALEKMVNITNH